MTEPAAAPLRAATAPPRTPATLTPGKPLRLSAGALIAELQPTCGARLARLARRDTRGDLFDYLMPLDSAPFPSDDWPKAGAFPMLPFTSALRDDLLHSGATPIVAREPQASSSQHGWGLRRPWEVVDESGHCCVLQLDSPAQPEWPWHYQAYLAFTLDAGGLDVQLSLTNLTHAPMPAGLGWHPYFRWVAGARLRFASPAFWTSPDESTRWPEIRHATPHEVDVSWTGQGLREERRSTWFAEAPTDQDTGTPMARIDYAGGLRALTVRSDDASWLVVHSPPGRPYLVLAPSTHKVGDFDADHLSVAHGQTVDLSVRIDLT